MKQIWKHPWVVVMQNLILVMAIYSLSRVFFFFINHDLWQNVGWSHFWEMIGGGLRFDLTAILYLNSVYIILGLLPLPYRQNETYQRVAKWFYWIPNILGIAINCIDMVYIRFTDRRMTFSFFSEFGNDNNLAKILWISMTQYWYVTFFALLMIIGVIKYYRRWEITENMPPIVYYLIESVLFVGSAYMTVIGIRGGFGAYTRPITLSNAMQYTNAPRESMIVLNTPFSMMRSSEGGGYDRVSYFSEEEIENIFSPIHQGNDSAAIRRDNVVILILESFSKEYIGFYNKHLAEGYNGYTPFLDSLLEHSVTYTHSFASGRKSIDAMPSVLSSIPMLIEPYVVTSYSTNAISSIADCLSHKGYTTAFFHGAPNGSMGFQAYARAAGFVSYYGLDEYKEEFSQRMYQAFHPFSEEYDGTWAIWDEPFLQFYVDKMNKMHEPFCTAVFTASSHHPFRVPKKYENTFPQGTKAIHPCIGYSDEALRKFFDYAQRQPWYEHTLFVLTADHTNELTFPQYTNDKGIYEIPIAFFHPQGNGLLLNEVISQTDIMPSVLGWLGYDEPYFAFGEDALTHKKEHPYAVCYNNPYYQLFSDSLLIQYDGEKIQGLFNYKKDPLLQNNQAAQALHREDIQEMMTYLKTYIQQYVNRMIDNRLIVK